MQVWNLEVTDLPPSETLALSGVWKDFAGQTLHELLDRTCPGNGVKCIQYAWEKLKTSVVPASGGLRPHKPEESVSLKGDLTPTSECPSAPDSGFVFAHGLTADQVAISTQDLEDHEEETQTEDVSMKEGQAVVDIISAHEPAVSVVVTLPCDGECVLRSEGDFRQMPDITGTLTSSTGDEVELSQPLVSDRYCLSLSNGKLTDQHSFGEVDELKPRVPSTSSCEVGSPVLEVESSLPSCTRSLHDDPMDKNDPLLQLQGKGFLVMQPPVVKTQMYVEALLAQKVPQARRMRALEAQLEVSSDDELRYHLHRIQVQTQVDRTVVVIDPLLMYGWLNGGDVQSAVTWAEQRFVPHCVYITVVLSQGHWFPLVLTGMEDELQVRTWDHPSAKHHGIETFCRSFAKSVGLRFGNIFRIHRQFARQDFCGAMSVAYIEHCLCGTHLPTDDILAEAHHMHLREMFIQTLSAGEWSSYPWMWGAGVGNEEDLAVEKLVPLLKEHGVFPDSVRSRAQQAVKAIGASEVIAACKSRNPWKQLKQIGTNVKFQFILQDELQLQIEQRAGKTPVGKPSRKSKNEAPKESSTQMQIDPTKIKLLEGIFVCGEKRLTQIPLTMLGPAAEGIVVATMQQAEPYLRAGQLVSTGPLAMLVLQTPAGGCQTMLQTSKITVPARCLANQEPILLEAVMAQLGKDVVSKAVVESPLEIETVKVVTMKLVVFRDECDVEWKEITNAPIRYVLKHVPILRLCRQSNCQCPCWHNEENVPTSDSILDLWRRQFLRAGYKPEPMASATIFTVCSRVPECLQERLLRFSGEGGVYMEPRRMDGRDISSSFEVIWVPKADRAALCHLRQTNPAVLGVARIGDRFGLRVLASQAASVHKVVRPDAVYLSQGVRQTFLIGPIPYGTDRKALSRALLKVPWEAKPLQPITAVEGQKGVMWTVVAVQEPPQNIVQMAHGEVVITRQKDQVEQKQNPSKPVAAPSTISLCGMQARTGQVDPWLKLDPWGGYQPTVKQDAHQTELAVANESLRQLETKIEQSVISKLPQISPMEQDDMPDRVAELETRFQALMDRQQKLESVVQETSTSQSAQIGHLQAQINAQGQQLSGQMEANQQTIQGMFEAQMSQIRSLLAKRPREDDDHE